VAVAKNATYKKSVQKVGENLSATKNNHMKLFDYLPCTTVLGKRFFRGDSHRSNPIDKHASTGYRAALVDNF